MPPLTTAEQLARLLANGRELARDPRFDLEPVMRLYIPGTSAAWHLCAVHPAVPSVAYALCEMGDGGPILGPISVPVLVDEAARLGLEVVPDPGFAPKGPISAYAAKAAAGVRNLADTEPVA